MPSNAHFVDALCAEISRWGGTVRVARNPLVALHRGWIDLKAALTVGRDNEARIVLQERLRGGRVALNTYAQARQAVLPSPVDELLQQQATQIQQAHDQLCGLAECGDDALLVQFFAQAASAQAVVAHLAASGLQANQIQMTPISQASAYACHCQRQRLFESSSAGAVGGTSGNEWNKFVPKPFSTPPAFNAWNELHFPLEYPFAHYEMSFLLPHMLEEGRGDMDVYFTRVYNPMWINPDGFMWLKALRDENKIKCHVALTPTWNESAWFADYILPMGHAGERHDLMSQETHAGQWIGFRQPVRRVALEKLGKLVRFTYEANPGEVWEESEFWIELSAHMDPDGKLGVRQWFESPYRKGQIITVDEYYQWIFENSVPGLPAVAAKEGLTPLQYMRKYGCFEVKRDNYVPYEKMLPNAAEIQAARSAAAPDQANLYIDVHGRVVHDSKVTGVMVDEVPRLGFETPSRKLEFFSPTLYHWGWTEKDYTIPWPLKSHVHPDNIDRSKGEMILLPNFRLPTLIHTRSANAKWLYEISHKNPVWMHPSDARRIGVKSGDLVRVETEIGYFVDKVWVTEGIKPGVIAMSHHLGRWRLQENTGVSPGMSNLVKLEEDANGNHRLNIIHGARPWETFDPDTSRIWWEDVGVHQNLTHVVHPDPISGAHCWLQKAMNVTKAAPGDKHGDVWVDIRRSMAVYHEWLALTRSPAQHSPDGTWRPMWLKRSLKPVKDAYQLPEPVAGTGQGHTAGAHSMSHNGSAAQPLVKAKA
jgi:hypothetical protein